MKRWRRGEEEEARERENVSLNRLKKFKRLKKL
jgi:hypothetical protein